MSSVRMSFNGNAPSGNNLALRKSATQSTTGSGGVASRAVDGNTSGIWNNGSITHTQGGASLNPWWRVDLGATYDVANAKDELFLNMKPHMGKKVSLSLVNHLGNQLIQQDIANVSTDLISMNTTQIQNGLYYVLIKVDGQKTFTKKVLIHRLY